MLSSCVRKETSLDNEECQNTVKRNDMDEDNNLDLDNSHNVVDNMVSIDLNESGEIHDDDDLDKLSLDGGEFNSLPVTDCLIKTEPDHEKTLNPVVKYMLEKKPKKPNSKRPKSPAIEKKWRRSRSGSREYYSSKRLSRDATKDHRLPSRQSNRKRRGRSYSSVESPSPRRRRRPNYTRMNNSEESPSPQRKRRSRSYRSEESPSPQRSRRSRSYRSEESPSPQRRQRSRSYRSVESPSPQRKRRSRSYRSEESPSPQRRRRSRSYRSVESPSPQRRRRRPNYTRMDNSEESSSPHNKRRRPCAVRRDSSAESPSPRRSRRSRSYSSEESQSPSQRRGHRRPNYTRMDSNKESFPSQRKRRYSYHARGHNDSSEDQSRRRPKQPHVRNMHPLRGCQNARERDLHAGFNERTIVFVGDIGPDIDEKYLYDRFIPFGPINLVKVVRRPEEGNYFAFIYYKCNRNAIQAVEHGNDDFSLKFNLGFGGRRAFCDNEYKDFDSSEQNRGRNSDDDLDLETLLQKHRQLQKKKR